MRSTHVRSIAACDDHQGKDHGSGEFDEKAWDIGQVVELKLQVVKVGINLS